MGTCSGQYGNILTFLQVDHSPFWGSIVSKIYDWTTSDADFMILLVWPKRYGRHSTIVGIVVESSAMKAKITWNHQWIEQFRSYSIVHISVSIESQHTTFTVWLRTFTCTMCTSNYTRNSKVIIATEDLGRGLVGKANTQVLLCKTKPFMGMQG